MSILEVIKIFLIVCSFVAILIGTSWSIIDKKFNYNTLLIICCIALLVAFNLKEIIKMFKILI